MKEAKGFQAPRPFTASSNLVPADFAELLRTPWSATLRKVWPGHGTTEGLRQTLTRQIVIDAHRIQGVIFQDEHAEADNDVYCRGG